MQGRSILNAYRKAQERDLYSKLARRSKLVMARNRSLFEWW